MSRKKQAGFTLVELLVVISIIGILVSLIGAAVMSAINRANQAVSMNHQREIWQAVQNYESKKQKYPGYAFLPVPSLATREASWVVAIMPYSGMNDLYDKWIDPAATATDIQSTLVGIPILIQPGDDQETPGGPWLCYVVNTGIPDGMTGTTESRATGLFFDHRGVNKITTNASDVARKDGLANTLGLAENRRAYMWTGYIPGGSACQEYLLGFNWEHYSSAPSSWLQYPINQKNTSTGGLLVDTAVDKSGARINGPHPGVAIVMFADGHAQALSEEIDYNVYNKLCTPDGSVKPHTSWPVQLPLDSAEYQF